MKKIATLTYLILGGLVLLVVGVSAGILLEKMALDPKLEKANTAIKAINSKLIPYITAFGAIQSISGRELTLNYSEETLTIKIRSDAKVLTIENKTDGTSAQKEIQMSDLNVGDYVNVNVNISQDNILEGSRVLVVPMINQLMK